MLSVAVTGSAGALGRRVVNDLVNEPSVVRVVAIDRRPQELSSEKVESVRIELFKGGDPAELTEALMGCDTVVHAASEEGRVSHHQVAGSLLGRVLDAATDAGVGHVVMISSAMVYGAFDDNPVPLAEDAPVRSDGTLAFVAAKLEMEQLATTWASTGRRAAILRPTTTLAESGTSWIGRTLRMATTIRPDRVDPPVQFLHYSDLSSAVVTVVTKQGSGIFNVAPDGFIGSEGFHQLVGGLQLRVPGDLSDFLLRSGRRLGIRPTPEGIEPYVRSPWVVANDKLRSLGWRAEATNEEAFVLGTPPPPWVIPPRRRQEVVLGLTAIAGMGAVALIAALSRRLLRR
ncbi:MAG: NAD-dependent epimerase/dehydratase family protein [Acidimicrobiales bacterium]